MKKATLPIILIIFLLNSGFLFCQNKPSSELPEKYKRWLEQEVVYIITPTEKEVFLQLSSDRERDLFIEAFWKQRDPTPNTPENEFKEEHYRRFNYANQFLGRGTPTPGWRTDMGKMYIILGEPKTIERYENLTEVYPTIVWFYQGMGKYGLPDAFNLVFYKKYGAGDYELYSPLTDGPQSLLVNYRGDPKDYIGAYYQLQEAQAELAKVSLSLLPDEPFPSVTPSVLSNLLLANIDVQPQKAVKDDYAEKLLKYKDIIEVEYTANYMDSNSFVEVIKDPSGLHYVHYAIEPDRLSVSANNNTYNTTLEVSGRITGLKGKTIYQFQKNAPIRFSEEERKKMGDRPFRYQGAFPIIEGNYTFNFLLKNRVSKEFTSFEVPLSISSGQKDKGKVPFILSHYLKKEPNTNKLEKAFQAGPFFLYPEIKNQFTSSETLTVFSQLPGLHNFEDGEKISFLFFKGDEIFYRKDQSISSYKNGLIVEEFPLNDFSPAYYRLVVQIESSGEKPPLILGESIFSITHQPYIPRPFIYSEPVSSPKDAHTYFILGNQLYNLGRLDEAGDFLERAHRQEPQSILYAEALGNLYLQKEEYNKVISILAPISGSSQRGSSILRILGQAYQKLGQYDKALTSYSSYLEQEGTHLPTLNAMGACFLALGQKDEALRAFQKSLEINPQQEEIEKIVSSLRKNK